ncbi:MAG: hypothetical protein KGO05_01795, partial [Chloroflexota bacterium]|nr:hypothetical protein [Chloroflexota bacterium]
MSEHDQPDAGRPDQHVPARKLAAIPSLRGPDTRPRWSRWTAPFVAAAVALVVIVVAAALVAPRAHPGAATRATGGASATKTASAQAQPGATTRGPLMAVAMVSPTDGWAIGQQEQAGQPGSQGPQGLLYHFDGSRWTPSKQAPAVSLPGIGSPSIQMVSPTEGWILVGPDQVLRYDGTAWRPETISLVGKAQIMQVMALDMVSPTEGWAAARLTVGSPQGAFGFLRYDGKQWTVEPGTFALPGLDKNSVMISSISATPGGDVWAVGVAIPNAPTGITNYAHVGLIFQRVNGAWRLASQLNQGAATISLIPNSILMTGPTNGWIVGSAVQVQQSSNGATENSHALLLHYDFHRTGARWVPVAAPIANPTEGDQLTTIVATGPGDIWVNGI